MINHTTEGHKVSQWSKKRCLTQNFNTMYNFSVKPKQRLFANIIYQGQSIEDKMREVTEKQEPIEMTAEMIYTERNEGVLPGYDIRTDRFEIAIDAADKINAMYTAKNKTEEPGAGEPGAGEPETQTE